MAPCSRCEKAGPLVAERCTVPKDPLLSRCGRCTTMCRACDVRKVNQMPCVADWEAIDSQLEKLFQEDEKAEKAISEAMSKKQRLRKQMAFLRERKQKMIAAGLNSMDELDALEEQERAEQATLLAAESEVVRQSELATTHSEPLLLAGTSIVGVAEGHASDLPTLSDEEWQSLLNTSFDIPQASPGV